MHQKIKLNVNTFQVVTFLSADTGRKLMESITAGAIQKANIFDYAGITLNSRMVRKGLLIPC